jgi:hypothetical protein
LGTGARGRRLFRYRLKEIDGLRKFSFSDTVSLTFTPPLTIRILPNPAFTTTSVIVSNADGPYVIRIMDLDGRIVKQLSGLPGTPVTTIGLAGLRGIYTVMVVTATSVASEKLIVL